MEAKKVDHDLRKAGVLMPFRALPGDHDHQGTLGPEAITFLDSVARAGFAVVHDLPVTPPDMYDSPYSSTSTFAIDPQRIDLYQLAESGDVSTTELDTYQKRVLSGDAGPDVRNEKKALLQRAFSGFMDHGSPERKVAFDSWCVQEAEWLDSFAAFEVLQTLPGNEGRRWQEWTIGRENGRACIDAVKAEFEEAYQAVRYAQWTADTQMAQYIAAAHERGIEIWNDVPFYVGDCEVWANRGLFNLDANGRQLNQGGAAPSMTSATGQMWGFATYKSGGEEDPVQTAKLVDWWTRRLTRAHKLSGGMVRLDHFIGMAEPYIIAADAENGLDGYRDAGIGKWVLANLVTKYGSRLPFYPEDLGTQTEATPALRDEYGLAANTLAVRSFTKYLLLGEYRESFHNPDNYRENSVNISSNHDSPPLVEALDTIRTQYPHEFDDYFAYIGEKYPHEAIGPHSSSEKIARLELERLMHSIGRHALIGMWDILKLGPEGRYNIPDTIQPSNWSWRMDSGQLADFNSQALYWRGLNQSSGRSHSLYVEAAAD